MEQVDFDQVKVKPLEHDYSILQISKEQMDIMEFNLNYLLHRLNISETALRTLVYQEFIKWQVENELYLTESENLSAMERLSLTERISQKIIERLSDLLVNTEELPVIIDAFRDLLDKYRDKYASR